MEGISWLTFRKGWEVLCFRLPEAGHLSRCPLALLQEA